MTDTDNAPEIRRLRVWGNGMNRKAAIAVSLLVAAGCVAAYVQAQDAGPTMEASRYGQPGMLPHHLPARRENAQASSPQPLSAALRAATADITTEYSGSEAAQVGHTSTIKPAQFKSTRPKPTYPSGNAAQSMRNRRTAPATQQMQQPSLVYSPVPTAPPTIEQPAAQVAERFGNRPSAPSVSSASTAEATLGSPVSTETADSPINNDATAVPEATPAGSAGMRSVLKRSTEGNSSSVVPLIDAPQSAKEPTDAPPTEADSTAAAISARRQSGGLVVPSTSVPSLGGARSDRREAEGTTDSRSIQELSLTGRSASLRVDVAGPQSLTVGKSATYVVNLFNDSDTDAQQVQVKATIPGWVSVSSGETTDGDASVQSDGKGSSRLLWTVPQVAARAHQTLRLTLSASEGRPFDLGLEWTMQPTAARATIAVEQPQIDLSLAGPADMIFGQQRVFTLTVSNPGNGDAERVVVSIASGDNRPQQIDVGSIPAGMQKEIPVQVVANHAGEMSMKAVAVAEGGLRAEAVGKVSVRRAAVIVAVEGPQLQYAGTDATYAIVLSNTGDAPAEDMLASVTLPAGAKYLGGIEGAGATPTALKWKVPSIPAGTERTYQLKLQLNMMGINRVVVQAHNEGGLAVSGTAETTVEAVSDLKLTVNDPTGPIAVGTEATYELTLTNRGTKSASGVRVVMQFGEGIEPQAVEGTEAKVVPGQVVCEPLAQLAAGEKVTFRVKAAADRAGTHQFRVEVTASDNDTRLVSEGTSRFFMEGDRMGAAARTARKPSLLPQTSVPDVLQR